MPIRRRSLLVISLIAGLSLTGCQSAYFAALEKVGYEKRDILATRVESARDAQEDAKKEIVSALQAFSETVAFSGGKLESRYKTLKSRLADSEDAAANVRDRLKAVQQVGDALFVEWAEELGQYSSADLRRRSQQQLTATKNQYRRLIRLMKKAESRLEPALRPLRDQVLFLKHNLNARALASLQGEVKRIDAQVDRLVADINQSVAEANRFIKSVQSGK